MLGQSVGSQLVGDGGTEWTGTATGATGGVGTAKDAGSPSHDQRTRCNP